MIQGGWWLMQLGSQCFSSIWLPDTWYFFDGVTRGEALWGAESELKLLWAVPLATETVTVQAGAKVLMTPTSDGILRIRRFCVVNLHKNKAWTSTRWRRSSFLCTFLFVDINRRPSNLFDGRLISLSAGPCFSPFVGVPRVSTRCLGWSLSKLH